MAFVEDGAFDPEPTRRALAELDVPVVVLAGAFDSGNPVPVMAEVAAFFKHADFVVQEGAGHFPWVDDPEAFGRLVTPFLRRASSTTSPSTGAPSRSPSPATVAWPRIRPSSRQPRTRIVSPG